MDGRAFLDSVQLLMTVPTEANWRSAVSRAYYAMLNETRSALERWGFSVPATAHVDDFVISRFNAVPILDLLRVADALLRLKENREPADYFLTGPGIFTDGREVRNLLQLAETGIDLLGQIEADPMRQAKAVAGIRTAFP